MVVPYGDPTAGWFFRNSFDVGELGLGVDGESAARGRRLPRELHACSTPSWRTSSGEPRVIPGAVALYERDGGIEWKHGDNTRRSRELVLSYWSQPGNYEYGFDWVFHQDGTLEMRVQLTGIMAAKGVANGAHDPYSHLVAPNVAAPHHQHFFAFRLDMDVDGTCQSRDGIEQRGHAGGAAESLRRRLHHAGDAAAHRARGAAPVESREQPQMAGGKYDCHQLRSAIRPATSCCRARTRCPSRCPIPGCANAPASSTRTSG